MKRGNQGSITIKDPSGNTWHMDGNQNITVTAPESMTLNCKNMNINVSENMNTTVGMNKSDNIGFNNTESVGGIKNLSVLSALETPKRVNKKDYKEEFYLFKKAQKN